MNVGFGDGVLIEREDGFGYQDLTEFAAPNAFGVTRVEFEKFRPS